jgi:phenylpyruvate tautomerase PptA (4-oxalocrotonate tautomerase family)
MPLIRIDVVEGCSEEELRAPADAGQEVLLNVFAAPARDRYQVIHGHKPGLIIAEDLRLGFERTDGVIVIQVTHQGRTEHQKRALYSGLADRHRERTGLAPSDLIVSVTENTRAD